MIKLLSITSVIVFISILIEIGLIYYQVTVGKLPWKIKLLPDIGNYLS